MSMENYEIEGIAHGMHYGYCRRDSHRLLLIKTGAGGTIHGDGGKYLHIAERFLDLGYGVLCCDTPLEMKDDESFALAMAIAKHLLGDGFADAQIYYVGASKGAYQGILYGGEMEQIKELLLVNSPLTVNFHRQTKALRGMQKPCCIVQGSADPTYNFYHFLKQIPNPNLFLQTIPDADHIFSAHQEIFEILPEKFFLRGVK